ncbi:MAG TPA: prolyl oligopeptidase family serine peptidase [Candidatus Angelobacter sp.]|nr:prolyl oligopeptidase family serine peptidase [Candidatus Angelobacter sp.]
MKPLRTVLIAIIFFIALSSITSQPQALPNLALSRLNYTVTKRRVNPQGELKSKIDAVDVSLAIATNQGQVGEVRRLIAKGLTLLAGKEWTDDLDFQSSLALRSEHLFVDSSKPYGLRLEQIYTPSLKLQHSLSAHVWLAKPLAPGGLANIGLPSQPAGAEKDLGKFDDVSRDLRESPFRMDVDVSGLPDGPYQIQAELFEQTQSLGVVTSRVILRKDLDATLARIENDAAKLPQGVRPEALYPVEYVRNVDRGRVEIGAFDIAKELASADQVLATVRTGKDPFADRTGDFKRHYLFKAAGEIMPYHIYVPTSYNTSRAFPLVVALHGLGASEDSMFSPVYGGVAKLAEQHGFIVVAPLGYRIDGGYGAFRVPGQNSRRTELSDQEVMEAFQLVKQQYKIDESRIYLMGHSMGGIGTWAMAANHPGLWAALGPISGTGDPAIIGKIGPVPQIVVHGDADDVVPVAGSRNMVAEMKKLGFEVKYIEVPGGNHGNVAAPNMAAIFDFFDAHRKGQAGAAVSGR